MNPYFRIFASFLLALLLPGLQSVFGQDSPRKDKPDLKTQTDPATGKPLSIGEQISHHIERLAEQEREKRMDFMFIVIEDITRLCDLNDSQKSQLVLAAKGASERSMKRWHEQAERYFRSRVNGADADTAKEILSNIGTVNFGSRGTDRDGESEELWKESLKNVLSNDQIAKYDEVVNRRNKARIEAFSQMAIAELDNFLRLTPEQNQKLGPIVRESAKENLDEVRRYWGDYLEQTMLMSLVNVADEETLTGILSDKQYHRLQSATSNLEHFWENRRRIKEAKESAEKKKTQQGKKEENKGNAPKAEAVRIGGQIKGGRVRIQAGAKGAVVIEPGAIFRGGDIQIEGGDIQIIAE